MPEFQIHLTREDTDRLFVCKSLEGKGNLTGNEYAAELLRRELHRLFPASPQYDEDGQLMNPDKFTG